MSNSQVIHFQLVDFIDYGFMLQGVTLPGLPGNFRPRNLEGPRMSWFRERSDWYDGGAGYIFHWAGGN